jgi:molybdopterin-synthase adenylyltransferase
MSIDAARFQRQMQLPRFGAEGQARLARARVLVAGCGALGTVVAEQLARAGVGTLVIVDRDIVEWSNLQRQTLFTEADARRGVPKAEAAKARLAQVHGGTVVRAFVDDLHGANALRYASEADLIVDCLDNFETRFVLDECAVKLGLPLVYGGAIAFRGMAAALLPRTGADRDDAHADGRERLVRWPLGRSTPCLRCLVPEPPAAGELETCETAGVLAAACGIVGSLEAAFTLRLLAEGPRDVPATLVRFDLGSMRFDASSLASAMDDACACCVGLRFTHIEAAGSRRARVLCGRNAVELVLDGVLDCAGLERIAQRMESLCDPAGEVVRGSHGGTASVKARLAFGSEGPTAVTVLAGETATLAIVEGTSDPERARAVVARSLGM